VLRLAHRGDRRRAPENSREALVAACALPGVDGVEFDVRASADGVPVIVHDEDLRPVHRIDRRVAEVTAAELRARGIPSLVEVLAALPADAFLDVELKEDLRDAAADLLREARGAAPARAVISSFQPRVLESVATLLPGWPRWLNVERLDGTAISLARNVGCEAISAHLLSIDERKARRVKEAGLGLVAWPVRRRSTLTRLERIGLLAACVDGSALG
jgi:glycerophosphoryl diester phosphodiesterase